VPNPRVLACLAESLVSAGALCAQAFADKLHDDDIANSFLQIVAKAKKLPGMAGEKKDKKDKDADVAPASGLRCVCSSVAGCSKDIAARVDCVFVRVLCEGCWRCCLAA